jgi:hypothetical protein
MAFPECPIVKIQYLLDLRIKEKADFSLPFLLYFRVC